MRLVAADHEVVSVPLAVCRRFVAERHYAKGGSNTGTYTHGLICRSAPLDCLGIAWWIPPTKDAAIRSLRDAGVEGDWRDVLALSRLAILPDVPKNAASFLVSGSVRLLLDDPRPRRRWTLAVAYADTWRGHEGAIYRACNWRYVGLTEPQPVWIAPTTGQMVARKRGPRTLTAAEMRARGYELAGHYAKHKFVLPLRRVRRDLMLRLEIA